MRNPRLGMATLLASCLAAAGAAPQESGKLRQPDRSPAYLGSIVSPGVASGYGNYWYPTGYPFPSIGGSGYVNYGPGGALGTYFSVPASSNFPAITPDRASIAVGPVKKPVTPDKSPSAGIKPAPARRKPR